MNVSSKKEIIAGMSCNLVVREERGSNARKRGEQNKKLQNCLPEYGRTDSLARERKRNA